jgi:hypothetical protein
MNYRLNMVGGIYYIFSCFTERPADSSTRA